MKTATTGKIGERSVLFCGICLLASCEPRLKNPPAARESPPELTPPAPMVEAVRPATVYPLAWELQNRQGKTLSGEITAKRGQEIVFRRTIDKKVYVVPLDSLSEDQQLDIALLDEFGEDEWVKLKSPSSQVASNRASGSFAHEALWHETEEAAFAAAKVSGKPVLFLFLGYLIEDENDEESTADAAAARKTVESFNRTVLNDRSFRSFVGEHFEVCFVDLRNEDELETKVKRQRSQLAAVWKVSKFPTLVISNSSGYEKFRIDGYDSRGPNLFIERLEAALDLK